MPEGDSIHRLAAQLAPVLVGREVRALRARRIPDADGESVVGRRVVAVEARGKNLLIRFDDGRLLHIHLRMEGRVFIERPRSTFWAPSRAIPDLRLAVEGAAIVGRRLPVCRLLTGTTERRTLPLATLGPDLLADDFDEEAAVTRLRGLSRRSIADALLVQRAAAGIGNIYKSEILFLEGIDPRADAAAIDDARLRAVLRCARRLLLANVGDGPRTTRRALRGPRLWVYGRGGRPCLRCGTAIVRLVQSGRSTYLCPRCQPETRA
jgi:endonuclease-8